MLKSIYLSKMGEPEKKYQHLKNYPKFLGLKKPPEYIEAYDISNTSGMESVGSMVVFEGGKPKRNDYRSSG